MTSFSFTQNNNVINYGNLLIAQNPGNCESVSCLDSCFNFNSSYQVGEYAQDSCPSLDLLYSGGSVLSGDSFCNQLGEWFYSTLDSILNINPVSEPQPEESQQPCNEVPQNNGNMFEMFQQFMNQIMTMFMSMFQQQPCPQPTPPVDNTPDPVSPVCPSEPEQPVEPSQPVQGMPETFNLEYGDTDYAVQYEDGHFTALVNGVDVELTAANNGHVLTVVDDQLFDLGTLNDDGDGTYSIDESTGKAPVNSVVGEYKLNYDGIDYDVTKHSNGTFTVKVGDEEIPAYVNGDGELGLVVDGTRVDTNSIIKEDGDGTFSLVSND